MPRSLHRGISAGASGSATSGVTTRYSGVSPPAFSLRRGCGRGGGGAGAGVGGATSGRLWHARGNRALLGVSTADSRETSPLAGAGCCCASSWGGEAAAIADDLGREGPDRGLDRGGAIRAGFERGGEEVTGSRRVGSLCRWRRCSGSHGGRSERARRGKERIGKRTGVLWGFRVERSWEIRRAQKN